MYMSLLYHEQYSTFHYFISITPPSRITPFLQTNKNVIIMIIMMDIIPEIKKIYEKYLFKNASSFSVDDYNSFQKEIWNLKDKLNYNDSPFLLLPDPAKDADYYMMNASNDGLTEPTLEAKTKYLSMMQESYKKL